MADTPNDHAVSARVDAPAAEGRHAAVTIVALTTATVVVVRLWVASQASMPKGPDVLGPWAAAFHLSRGPIGIDMYDLPPYSVGMGVVLAPLVRVVDDPALRYQIAVALLGLSSLFAGWCIARFVRASTDADPVQQAVAFCVTSAITAVAFSSTFTWAEPLVLAWLCAWLALVAWSMGSARWWSPSVVASLASTAPLVHGRVVLIPVIWCAASLLTVVLRRRRGVRSSSDLAAAGGVVLVTALVTALSQLLRSSVVTAVWSSADLANDTQVVDHVGEPAFWGAVLIESVGQLWYATTSTFGLAPIGVAVVVAMAAGRLGSLSGAQRRSLSVAAAGLASVWAVGVLFIASGLTAPGPERLDYLIYGRYGDPAVVVFAACGAAFLVSAARRTAVVALGGSAALLLVTGLFTTWRLHGLDERPEAINEGVISGVASFPLDRPGLDLLRWSALALTAIGAFASSRLGGRVALSASITVVVLLGGVAGSVRAVEEHRAWDNSVLYLDYPGAPVARSTVPVAQDTLGRDAYRFNMPSQQYVLAAQGWQLEVVPESSDELVTSIAPDHHMVVLRYTAGAPSAEWCHISRYDDVIVWVRTTIAAGEPGGECSN